MSATPQGNPSAGVGSHVNLMDSFYKGDGLVNDQMKGAYTGNVVGDWHNVNLSQILGPNNAWLAMQGMEFAQNLGQLDSSINAQTELNTGLVGGAALNEMGNLQDNRNFDKDLTYLAAETGEQAYLDDVSTDNDIRQIGAEAGANILVDDAASANRQDETFWGDRSQDISTVVGGQVDQGTRLTQGAIDSSLSSQTANQNMRQSFADGLIAENQSNIDSLNRQDETITSGAVTDKSRMVDSIANIGEAYAGGAIEASNRQVQGMVDTQLAYARGDVDLAKGAQNIQGQLATGAQQGQFTLAGIEAEGAQQALNTIVQASEARKTQQEAADQELKGTSNRINTQGDVDLVLKKEEGQQMLDKINAERTARSAEIEDQSKARSTEISDQSTARSTEIADQATARSAEIADQTAARSTEIADQTAARSTEIADQSAARVTEIGAEDDSARNKENRAAARSRSLARAF
tara:strand:- start:15 stop:1406 length:1392 start_codon:yes stop_codon:yes gene_type:complete